MIHPIYIYIYVHSLLDFGLHRSSLLKENTYTVKERGYWIRKKRKKKS